MEETSNLDLIEKAIWEALTDSALQNNGKFRYLHLASVNAANEAESRVVVLRDVATHQHLLSFHTDYRSDKVKQIKSNPFVSLSVYDQKSRIQLRVKGKTEVFHKNHHTAAILEQLSLEAKKTYGLTLTEGALESKDLQLKATYQPETVEENFVVLQFSVTELKYLLLGAAYHTAAVFTYNEGKLVSKKWVMP